jgi:hypothetical protein
MLATRTQLVAHTTERLQEALRMLGGFEVLKDPLAFAYWQMRILHSAVEVRVASVLGRR